MEPRRHRNPPSRRIPPCRLYRNETHRSPVGPTRRSGGDISGVGGDARVDVLLHVATVAATDVGGGGVLRPARWVSGGGNGGEEAVDRCVENAAATGRGVSARDGGILLLDVLLAVLSAVHQHV